MAETRQLSPAARAMRHRGMLGWGIGLVGFWLLITIPVTIFAGDTATEKIGYFGAMLLLFGLFLVLGLILLIIGIVSERKATRFNQRDWALSDGLGAALNDLWHQPAITAYAPDDNLGTIKNARLVEIERHFDSQTEGAISGTMSHQLRMFGTSFSSSYGSARATNGGRTASFSSSSAGVFSGSIRGLSQVNLGVSTTTRNNLMGDALFAVFEAAGPAGDRDTFRVISMSRPGVESWINDLVQFAAAQVGGGRTHAGSTILSWAGNLMAQFAPGDISYVTDRLKALHSRPYEQRELVSVAGAPAGRNALIATSMSIAGAQDLHLMPSTFPAMFGHAVATGIAEGERQLSGGGPTRQSIQA